jgi:hypothetical protein
LLLVPAYCGVLERLDRCVAGLLGGFEAALAWARVVLELGAELLLGLAALALCALGRDRGLLPVSRRWWRGGRLRGRVCRFARRLLRPGLNRTTRRCERTRENLPSPASHSQVFGCPCRD